MLVSAANDNDWRANHQHHNHHAHDFNKHDQHDFNVDQHVDDQHVNNLDDQHFIDHDDFDDHDAANWLLRGGFPERLRHKYRSDVRC